MTRSKRITQRQRTTVETYSGSLAELAITATKEHRELSWEELEHRVRNQISAPTGPHSIIKPDDKAGRPTLRR